MGDEAISRDYHALRARNDSSLNGKTLCLSGAGHAIGRSRKSRENPRLRLVIAAPSLEIVSPARGGITMTVQSVPRPSGS